MRNPAVGLRTNVRPYGKAAHCFSLIGTMNSLFFIDPNNENANLCACAVGDAPCGKRREPPSPGSTLRLFSPVIYRKNGSLACRTKGFWRNEPNCKKLVERRPRAAQAFDARAALFRFEPALAGAGGRLGRPGWHRRPRGAGG